MKKVFVISLIYPSPFSIEPVKAYIPKDGNCVVFLPTKALQFDTYQEAEESVMTQKTKITDKDVCLHIEKIFIP